MSPLIVILLIFLFPAIFGLLVWGTSPKKSKVVGRYIIDVTNIVEKTINGNIDLTRARQETTKKLDKIISSNAPKEKEDTVFCCWTHGYVKPAYPRISINGHILKDKYWRPENKKYTIWDNTDK